MKINDVLEDLGLVPEDREMPWLAILLTRQGVAWLEADHSGGGDEGSLDEIRYLDDDGHDLDHDPITSALRAVRPPFASSSVTALEALHQKLDNDANDEGNWYDGVGGVVNARYEITETGLVKEYCTLTYNEYDEDDEEPEPEEDDEPEFEDEGEDEDHDADDDAPEP